MGRGHMDLAPRPLVSTLERSRAGPGRREAWLEPVIRCVWLSEPSLPLASLPSSRHSLLSLLSPSRPLTSPWTAPAPTMEPQLP